MAGDPAVIGPAKLLVETLLPQLRAACAAIERFHTEIASLCAECPGHRTQREQVLGPLALGVPDLPAPALHRVGRARPLAFEWIRILHRCWTDRIPYDESRYLLALQKRQAPLLKFAIDAPT